MWGNSSSRRSVKDKPVTGSSTASLVFVAGVAVLSGVASSLMTTWITGIAASGNFASVSGGISSLRTSATKTGGIAAGHSSALPAAPAVNNLPIGVGTSKVAEDYRHILLHNEHVAVTRVELGEELGGQSFMMSDNSAEGSDPILKFLLEAESHVMSAFYRSMDPKSCSRNKEQGLTAFVADCLQPRVDGRIWMADVGSNSGFYGQMVAALGYPVVQIDPQPHCTQYVRAATLASGFGDRVLALNAFAGDKSVASFDKVQQRTGCWGTFPFLTPDQFQSLKGAMANSPGWEDPVPVPMIRLDDVVFGSGSGSEDSRDIVIGAMKVDVEGSEDKMLLGAERLLTEGRIYHIIMELNKPAWESAKVSHETAVAMLVRLGNTGYKCRMSNYGDWHNQANFDMGKARLTKLVEEGWSVVDMWCSLAADKRYKLPAA